MIALDRFLPNVTAPWHQCLKSADPRRAGSSRRHPALLKYQAVTFPPCPVMLLKTEKARHELMPGVRTLSLRERSLLLLADGKPLQELQAMYHGLGRQMVDDLMRAGYFCALAPDPGNAPATAVPPVVQPPHAPLRSLAGTRMYLFDICERMFARRNPPLAEQYRAALRDARDRWSMLDVGEALLEDVGYMAGAELATAIRERMVQLLPQEAAPSSPGLRPALLRPQPAATAT